MSAWSLSACWGRFPGVLAPGFLDRGGDGGVRVRGRAGVRAARSRWRARRASGGGAGGFWGAGPWRRSYARRSGAERGFATAKDPASNDISRGWCRLMGLAPLTLFTVALLAVRNQRILHAWDARQEENTRRAARGLPPRTRRRRRRTLTALATAAGPP